MTRGCAERGATALAVLLACGCTDDLLPGETVLGAELAVAVEYGEPDSRFGEVLAWREGSLAVAAPGLPAVWLDGEWEPGPALWVGWQGEELVRVGVQEADVAGVDISTVARGDWFAASSSSLYFATDTQLHRFDGASVEVAGIVALAASDSRVAAIVCGESCAVQTWDADLAASLPAPALPAGLGGALTLEGDLLCSGDPDLATDDAPGRVACEDGREVEGAVGDHLGGAIGGGYAAGSFNKWVVPPRGRLVPLDGGEVLVVERGAVGQPFRLAGGDGVLIVGAPYQPHEGRSTGAVVTVPLP